MNNVMKPSGPIAAASPQKSAVSATTAASWRSTVRAPTTAPQQSAVRATTTTTTAPQQSAVHATTTALPRSAGQESAKKRKAGDAPAPPSPASAPPSLASTAERTVERHVAVADLRRAVRELVHGSAAASAQRERTRVRKLGVKLAALLHGARAALHALILALLAESSEQARRRVPLLEYHASSVAMLTVRVAGAGEPVAAALQARGCSPELARELEALLCSAFERADSRTALLTALGDATGLGWCVAGACLCLEPEALVFDDYAVEHSDEQLRAAFDARLEDACALDLACDELDAVQARVRAALCQALLAAADLGHDDAHAYLELDTISVRVRTAWATVLYASERLEYAPLALLVNQAFAEEHLARLLPPGTDFAFEKSAGVSASIRVHIE